MIKSSSAVQDKFPSRWRNSRQEPAPLHPPWLLAPGANCTIHLMCFVHVNRSKHACTQPGNPGFAQAMPFSLFSNAFHLENVSTEWEPPLRWAYPQLWICPRSSWSKEKHLIVNYSNVPSCWKHFKDVYLETRCLLHRQPPLLLILHLHRSLGFSQ